MREIGSVQGELRALEHRGVERDLDVVLSAFSNGTRAFARRRRRSGGDDGFERALGKRLQEMRDDLTALVRTINATRNELAEARQAVGTTEKALESARGAERRARLADRLRDGRAAVDYESGEVAGLVGLLSPHELRRLVSRVGSTNATALKRIWRESFSQAVGRASSSRRGAASTRPNCTWTRASCRTWPLSARRRPWAARGRSWCTRRTRWATWSAALWSGRAGWIW